MHVLKAVDFVLLPATIRPGIAEQAESRLHRRRERSRSHSPRRISGTPCCGVRRPHDTCRRQGRFGHRCTWLSDFHCTGWGSEPMASVTYSSSMINNTRAKGERKISSKTSPRELRSEDRELGFTQHEHLDGVMQACEPGRRYGWSPCFSGWLQEWSWFEMSNACFGGP
ncbi:hypothetical protein VTK56DRAFT_6401 [Thermocarpiscus australiensis]